MTPEQFVLGIIRDCNARALFCGENFTFGAKAAGTPELLRQLSGIGTNINQIAKVANASGYVRKEDIQSIMEMQAALWRAVKRG